MVIVGIYKITNHVNGKIYIGRSIDIDFRWKQHLREKKSRAIDNAIRKYGKENFTIEVLEECSIAELNEREIYWIAYYDTYLGDCYNCTPGGDGVRGEVTISAEMLNQIIDTLRNTTLPIRKIAEQFNIASHTVSAINAGKTRRQDRIKYPIRQTYAKDPIYIDKNMLCWLLDITEYNYKKIAQYYSVSEQRIRQICYGYNIELPNKKNVDRVMIDCSQTTDKIDISKSYKIPLITYQFKLDEKIIYNTVKNNTSSHLHLYRVPVYQCDLNDNIINKFNTMLEAHNQTGYDDKSIRRALNSQTHYACHYKWYRCDEYDKTQNIRKGD